MSLVEMDVAVDERRQEELSRKIDALMSLSRGSRRMRGDDKAAGDFYVGETSVRKARVAQNHQTRLSRFAATYL
jgi:hypothetical protein